MKTKLIQVRTSEVLYDQIVDMSREKGMTPSEYVRYVLQVKVDGKE